MKYQTTTKAIKNNYGKYIFSLGYCELQELFNKYNAQAYTAGVYGWNYDIHDLDGIAICTGYRPITSKWMPADIVKKYKKRVAQIKAHKDELNNGKQWRKASAYYERAIEQARHNLARDLYALIREQEQKENNKLAK